MVLDKIQGPADSLKNLKLASKIIEALPVIIVGNLDDSGEMSGQGALAAIQAAVEAINAKIVASFTFTGNNLNTRVLTMPTVDTKRGAGGQASAVVTGAGADIPIDIDLSETKELAYISISAEATAGGAPTALDKAVAIFFDNSNPPTTRMLQSSSATPVEPVAMKVAGRARYVRATIYSATVSTIYRLSVAYWDL